MMTQREGRDWPRIAPIIVVEGLHDKQAVLAAVAADVWVLGGDRVSRRTLQELGRAAKVRGLIVFTDPDGPGERIRRRLAVAFPNCQHAFVPRPIATRGGRIGVEFASPSAIRQALTALKEGHATPSPVGSTDPVADQAFTLADLAASGMVGHPGAANRRVRAGNRLGIGYGNAKAFVWKLNTLGITRAEWIDVLQHIQGDDDDS